MLSFDQSSYSHYHQPPSSAADMTVTKRIASARHKHLFIVTGPAGCGKTTVAEFLADWSSLPYLECDDVRPRPPPRAKLTFSASTTPKPTSTKCPRASPSPTPTAGTG
jgi:hypothetical protein